MKKNPIPDIESYLRRQKSSSAHPSRFPIIINAYLEASKLPETAILRTEANRHLIVSMVAWMQDRLREIIRETIDTKDAGGHAIPDFPDVKITIELVRKIKKEEFSLGDLFAHILGVSSPDGVNGALKLICGESLYDLIKPYHLNFKNVSPERALDLFVKFKDGFEELYRLRNILAHEEARDFHITEIQAYEFIRIGVVFEVFTAQHIKTLQP